MTEEEKKKEQPMEENKVDEATESHPGIKKEDTHCKYTKFSVGGFEININQSAFNIDSSELLEKLYLIKQDHTLSNDQKQIKLQELIKKYVG